MRFYKQPFSSACKRYAFRKTRIWRQTVKNKQIYIDVKQLKMIKFIKFTWNWLLAPQMLHLGYPRYAPGWERYRTSPWIIFRNCQRFNSTEVSIQNNVCNVLWCIFLSIVSVIRCSLWKEWLFCFFNIWW